MDREWHVERRAFDELHKGLPWVTQGQLLRWRTLNITSPDFGLFIPFFIDWGDTVHPAYRLSINGDRFVSDPVTPLVDGDALLLLAADAGG